MTRKKRRTAVTLEDLADYLGSYSEIVATTAEAAAPEILEQLRTMGREGGPLRGGNAVVAAVSASGTQVRVTCVDYIIPDGGWESVIRGAAEAAGSDVVPTSLYRFARHIR